MSRRVFVSRDVVFEEGHPSRTSAGVGEETFEAGIELNPPADNGPITVITDKQHHVLDQVNPDHIDNQRDISEPRRSHRMIQMSNATLQSIEYKKREMDGNEMGQDWATDTRKPKASTAVNGHEDNNDVIACLADTKSSHNIPRSYKHAIATDKDRWMIPMRIEMDTLKAKHTWDLVKPPPGANIMDSMWVFDIKWDGEGNRIKDKARLVGKEYTQQLGIDYNETWAGVTRLESV